MNSSEKPLAKGDCYKYQWARYVARRSLEKSLATVKTRIKSALDSNPAMLPKCPLNLEDDVSISHLLHQIKGATGTGLIVPKCGEIKVGVVGAGVAGLFTALLFDWLNKQVQGLHIDYDIFEAADESRIGGRLFTHKFSQEEHDYYDVGAMRFPDNMIS